MERPRHAGWLQPPRSCAQHSSTSKVAVLSVERHGRAAADWIQYTEFERLGFGDVHEC